MFVSRRNVLIFIAVIVIIILITTTVVLVKDNNENTKNVDESKKPNNEQSGSLNTHEVTTVLSTTTVLTDVTEAESNPGDSILQGLSKFQNSGIFTPQAGTLFSGLSPTHTLFDGAMCITCLSIMGILLQYQKTHTTQEVRDLAQRICVFLQNQNEDVCAGLLNLNMDTLSYIFNNAQGLTPGRICGIIFQGHGCSSDDPSLEWTVDVDLGVKPKVNMNSKKAETPREVKTIIQLSDIHYDPTYLPNGNAECGKPMCCRNSQGSPGSLEAAAGYWGDYRSCDIPWHTVQNILQQIKKSHKKIDYIYMTGDIVDHAVWNTSIETNTAAIKKFLTQLKKEFPDISVYPILGNHEPSPANIFAPTNITDKKISTNWVYELMADQWSVWLPPETKETILQGGFYTVLVQKGFRIIALNNNLCYTYNWWLIYDPKDPCGQLKWLAETLLQAEKNGEKVHILSHIPSGYPSCLKTWSREFHKIIHRFEAIITAQFNGHTHNDHFYLYYATDEPTRANHVAFNGGSFTPFSDLNPNYKSYVMDPSTFNILDSETWIFNLTEANLNGPVTPNWIKLYSFKETYEVESLEPSDLDKLIHQMATNRQLLEKYARFFVKEADAALKKGCNTDCLRNKLCEIATAETGSSTQCDILKAEFQTVSGTDTENGFIQFLKLLMPQT